MTKQLASQGVAAYWARALVLQLLPGPLKSSVLAFVDRPDPGKFDSFVRKLKDAVGSEFREVGIADTEAIEETLKLILDQLTQSLLDKSRRQEILAEALEHSSRWHDRFTNTDPYRAAIKSFQTDSDAAQYLEISVMLLADLVSIWIADSMGGQQPVVTAGIADLQRTAGQLREEFEAVRIGVDEVSQRLGTDTAQQIVADYREQTVLALAPAALLDRSEERKQVEEFIRGDLQVFGWRAAEKAGKTGLLSTIVRDGLDRVDIVPFFIEERRWGANDRRTFVTKTLAHLAHLAGDTYPPAVLDPAASDTNLANEPLTRGHCKCAARQVASPRGGCLG